MRGSVLTWDEMYNRDARRSEDHSLGASVPSFLCRVNPVAQRIHVVPDTPRPPVVFLTIVVVVEIAHTHRIRWYRV